MSQTLLIELFTEELPPKALNQLGNHLAQSIADFIFAQFHAAWVRIRITKPGILPRVAAVGVEIERHNPQKQPAP